MLTRQMLTRMIAGLALAVLSAVMATAACLHAEGNRILGRDLTAADSRFAALPATLTIGFAPAPGTKRVFSLTELQRIARANGMSVEGLTEICFELAMHPLKTEDAVTAMRSALPADAALRIVELPVTEVPLGQIEFPITRLEPPLESNHGVQLWRGDVVYAETRRVSIWARVEVTSQYNAVVATRNLPADTPIDAGSLRLETRTGPLQTEKSAIRIEDVQGRIAKRAIKAGTPIPVAILAAVPAVRRGDAVTVMVESGLAHLRFEAIAENSARNGEMVELRNPVNGKTFRAKLNSDRSAVVIINVGRKL
jgi:flagella basal body P-ring formation protein FlgA